MLRRERGFTGAKDSLHILTCFKSIRTRIDGIVRLPRIFKHSGMAPGRRCLLAQRFFSAKSPNINNHFTSSSNASTVQTSALRTQIHPCRFSHRSYNHKQHSQKLHQTCSAILQKCRFGQQSCAYMTFQLFSSSTQQCCVSWPLHASTR